MVAENNQYEINAKLHVFYEKKSIEKNVIKNEFIISQEYKD